VEAFVVDPIPRVIERDEWDALASGLAQRAASQRPVRERPDLALNATATMSRLDPQASARASPPTRSERSRLDRPLAGE